MSDSDGIDFSTRVSIARHAWEPVVVSAIK
jgi:hypothetical protein